MSSAKCGCRNNRIASRSNAGCLERRAGSMNEPPCRPLAHPANGQCLFRGIVPIARVRLPRRPGKMLNESIRLRFRLRGASEPSCTFSAWSKMSRTSQILGLWCRSGSCGLVAFC
jgi:hypothetical protein